VFSINECKTASFAAHLFPDDYKGVYVDIGAGFPEWYSNSFPFRALGWTVIAIEPQPKMCAEFAKRGLDVLQFACSDQDKGLVDFEILNNTSGLAGSAFKVLDDHPQSLISTIRVKARSLTSLMDEFYPDIARIDILDIDVEYYELEVLRGVDFARFQPTVLLIENLPSDTGVWLNPHRDELYAFYEEIEYEIVGRAGFNEILTRRKGV